MNAKKNTRKNDNRNAAPGRAPGGVVARIRGMTPSMLPAEQKVADYILNNTESILAQSVGEVAKYSGVSEATVIRFSRTAGFTGFQNLKISVARQMVSSLAGAIHEDINAKDDIATVARKVFAANIDALKETLNLLDPVAVERAIGALCSATKILVIGVGTSAPVAYDAYAKLMRLGAPVSLQTDAHLQLMEAVLLGKGSVILAISHSGSTIDPVQTAKAGKKAGARIISITSNALSPLAKLSDVTLLTASKETQFRSEALSSRIAQASALDLLYVAYGLKNKRQAIRSSKKIEDVIAGKQY